jgi:hypothetical protein
MKNIYKKILIFMGFITVFTLFFMEEAFTRNRFMTAENTSVEVKYSLKRGSITQDYEIFINNKGEVVVYEHNSFAKEENRPMVKNAKLAQEQLTRFKQFIIDSNVFELDNEYLVNSDTIEYDNERLKFTLDGKVKDIVISMANPPARLKQIIKKIEEIKALAK